jgi:hypothetical protein
MSQRKRNIDNKQKRVLYYLNVFGFIIHLSSFIAALVVSIIFAPQSYQSELSTDFNGHYQSLGSYSLIWVDLPFPIITAFFHALIAFSPSIWNSYAKSVLETQEGNSLRWIEYSITASLMIWVIMQLAGITNVLTLIVGGVLGNIAMQWQGYLQETFKTKTYIPTFVGWIIFIGQWSTILTYFFSTNGNVPWFVYSIVIGLLILFSIFGLIQLTYVTKYPQFMSSAYAQEIAYLLMSLTAKLFLTWNLLIGIATR